MDRQAGCRTSATQRRAQAIEVEARVVDLEPVLRGEPLGDRGDVALPDLLDPPAAVAGKVVMMLRPAGDVAIDVPVLLEPSGDAGGHERLERAEDGCAADARVQAAQSVVQVLGGDLASGRGERIGDEEALACDALAGSGEAIGRGGGVEDRGRHGPQRLARIDPRLP